MVNTKTLKLLLIDDLTNANLVGAMLQKHCEQLNFNHVNNMEEAIDSLNSSDFDAVLLNLSLSSHNHHPDRSL